MKWGIVSGFWLFFGLLNASQLYLGLRMEAFPVSVGRMFAAQLLAWGAWAFLTPLVLWLGRRFPVERASLMRGLAVHIPACLAVAAAHLAFFEYVIIKLEPFGPERHPRTFGEQFLGRATSQLHIELLIYAATLGLGYAVRVVG